MKKKNQKKSKTPNISDKEAAELPQAAQAVFGNQSADEFIDEVLALVPMYQKLKAKRRIQTRIE